MPAVTIPVPVSPLADVLPTTPTVGAEAARKLGLADISLQPRFGCKGPGAAAWLQSQGVALPERPNSAAALAAGGRVLRLGVSEFLVEGDAALVERLLASPRAPAVYPVLRQDACLLLAGERLNDLLLQSCNVNFAAIDPDSATVVLTSMVGVGVTVLPEKNNGVPSCRVWCDGSYGPYLWQTLRAIAEELGGGAAAGMFVPSI